ncbi:MAG: SAM-dependent methyltransferase [Bacteroidia bacterium]
MNKGKLYLLPVTLGEETAPEWVLPPSALEVMRRLKTFIVEDEKSARRFLKKAGTLFPISELQLHPIGKHVNELDMRHYLDVALAGGEIGLLSEAGCPGVADPGAEIVRQAHQQDIRVVPLTGPSSLLLALMASGMNGQSFCFHGYLPIDKSERQRAIRALERDAHQRNETQFFIETPYRNKQVIEELLQYCSSETRLCIACDLTLETEYVRTLTIAKWKHTPLPDLHKRPAVFLLGR